MRSGSVQGTPCRSRRSHSPVKEVWDMDSRASRVFRFAAVRSAVFDVLYSTPTASTEQELSPTYQRREPAIGLSALMAYKPNLPLTQAVTTEDGASPRARDLPTRWSERRRHFHRLPRPTPRIPTRTSDSVVDTDVRHRCGRLSPDRRRAGSSASTRTRLNFSSLARSCLHRITDSGYGAEAPSHRIVRSRAICRHPQQLCELGDISLMTNDQYC